MAKRKLKDSALNNCPICIENQDENQAASQTAAVSWIECSVCSQWYHSHCVNLSEQQTSEFKSYHCHNCVPEHGPSVIRRKSARSRASIDYVALNEGNTFAVDKSIHPHIRSFHNFQSDPSDSGEQEFVRVRSDVSKDFCLSDASALSKPIHIPQADLEKVGMELPIDRKDITVQYVTEQVGEDTPVEVMDVLTQQGLKPGWKMAQWRDYFCNMDVTTRDRIRNVISLEISESEELGSGFVRPQMVRDMDIVDKIWTSSGESEDRPKVTKYCLMSVAGSFTDFHIDFGGTSVYYTVCSGSKEFLMFPPTDHNLKLYTNWCLEQDQNFMWFPDYNRDTRAGAATDGFKVSLKVGDLFIIPSGWIHSVYTPEDSVVIGGNYLTLVDLEMQLKINDIERTTKVPARFRFPSFNKVWWLTSWYYYQNPHLLKSDLVQVTPKLEDNEAEDSKQALSVRDLHKKLRQPDAAQVVSVLVSHLQKHYELSKTFKPARASIPFQLVGRDPTDYLEKLGKLVETPSAQRGIPSADPQSSKEIDLKNISEA